VLARLGGRFDPALPWLPRLFVLVALPSVLAMALLFPIGEGPDEATQAARAASVLHGQWIGRRVQIPHPADGVPVTVAGVDINPGYVLPFLALPSLPLEARKPVTLDAVQAAAASRWPNGLVFIEASNTASYLPLFYLPSAAGMGLAALVRAGPMQTVLAGRIANALFCVLAGYLVLRLARRGRPALFALLALPMTLHLAATINQDGPLIATAALAAALLPQAGGRYWMGVAALACVVAAKPPYLPLAAAALVPLDGASWRARQHGAACLVVVAAGLAWAGAAATFAAVPFLRTPYHPGLLWSGPDLLFHATDPAAQLQVLLHRPALFLRLPLDTLMQGWRYFASTAVGVFASLDFNLPAWFYRVWYAALAAAALAAAVTMGGRAEPSTPRPWASLALATAAVSCLAGLILLQYLTWTEVGHATVEGMQGRYLLPVFAILVPALPALRLPAPVDGVARTLLSAPAAAAGLLGLGALPVLIVLRYYLR